MKERKKERIFCFCMFSCGRLLFRIKVLKRRNSKIRYQKKEKSDCLYSRENHSIKGKQVNFKLTIDKNKIK